MFIENKMIFNASHSYFIFANTSYNFIKFFNNYYIIFFIFYKIFLIINHIKNIKFRIDQNIFQNLDKFLKL